MNKKFCANIILTCSLMAATAVPAFAQNYTKDKAWIEKPATLEQPIDIFYLPSPGKSKNGDLKKEVAPYSTVGDVYAPDYKKPKDAQKALTTYLEKSNQDRPFILAAAPESADLVVSLYKGLDPKVQKNVIATYAPGARVVSFKPNAKKNTQGTQAATTHSRALRKRLEALKTKEQGKKTVVKPTDKPASKIITQLPAENFAHSLQVNAENFLEKDTAYYKFLTKKYTLEAKGFLKEIQGSLKIRDYNLKLRKPRDTRLYTRDIVIHHSGTPTDMDLSAKAIQNMHLHNGWYGIGYHFVVRKNGTVEVGTPLQTIGAHSYMHNSNTIGIHLSGNFEIGRPTKAQLTSLEKLIAYLAKDYRLNLNDNLIWGHRHYNHDTACPGRYLNNLLPEIRQGAKKYEARLLSGKSL